MKRYWMVVLFLAAVLLAACQRGEKSREVAYEATVEEIRDAVKDAYGETYYPSMVYTKSDIKEQFKVDPDWCQEILAEGPMLSFQVDTFVAAKAKDEESAGLVEDALKDYHEYLVSESMQYPMNMEKVNASRVVRVGNYVCFLMLGEIPMEEMDKGEEAAYNAAVAQNQIGEDAIVELLTTKR